MGKVTTDPLLHILDGMEHLENLDYTHRDLKPDNILLDGERWKLADFGLAGGRPPPTGGATRLTNTTMAGGTDSYMSPEQYFSLKLATPASDIYAFGCILHDYVYLVPRTPQSHITGAPGPFAYVIEKCTEKEPKKRFKNVAALRSALVAAFAASTDIEANPDVAAWTKALEDVSAWTPEKAVQFAGAMETDETLNKSSWGQKALLNSLDEDRLKALHAIDEHTWQRIASLYCDYARGWFDFSFSSEVGKRLQTIYNLGRLSVKSNASLAAAELARSHDRWSVMRVVHVMCQPSIDINVANRIASDIDAHQQAGDFRACVDGLEEIDSFYKYQWHPKILSTIAKKRK